MEEFAKFICGVMVGVILMLAAIVSTNKEDN